MTYSIVSEKYLRDMEAKYISIVCIEKQKQIVKAIKDYENNMILKSFDELIKDSKEEIDKMMDILREPFEYGMIVAPQEIIDKLLPKNEQKCR